MAQPKSVSDVKLFTAVTFRDQTVYEKIQTILVEQFGEIDLASEIYDFNFTDYYTAEMGANLKKQFLGFQKLIHPESLVEIKLWTNEIEQKNSIDGRRQVNIDPGYITGANVVLATTKNYSHRIYLGKGIYGDVHLRFRKGKFEVSEWTYPDYQQPLAIDFFTQLRERYRELLIVSKNFTIPVET